MSLSEAASCCIEQNDPPIGRITLNIIHDYGPNIKVDVTADTRVYNRMEVLKTAADSRRLARAVNNNSTLEALSIHDEANHVMLMLGADHLIRECIGAFYDELKNNKSILDLCLVPIDGILPLFDLGYFMQNNMQIKYLTLGGQMTPEQGNIIAAALEGVHLKSFDMGNSPFETGVIEQILHACLGVEELRMRCETNSQITALAALLQDPRAVLQCLEINSSVINDFDVRLALREIAASLVGNTMLKDLSFGGGIGPTDEFDNLLCDCTSLKNICNSNHTLEAIEAPNDSISDRTKDYLEINNYQNKCKVVQDKIIQYYFLGEFDLSSFASMPLSMLSEVMSLGEEMSNQQTAIFELLRGIPDLCHVSNRGVEEFKKDTTDDNLDFKLQKVNK
jgi:hypothetical protein